MVRKFRTLRQWPRSLTHRDFYETVRWRKARAWGASWHDHLRCNASDLLLLTPGCLTVLLPEVQSTSFPSTIPNVQFYLSSSSSVTCLFYLPAARLWAVDSVPDGGRLRALTRPSAATCTWVTQRLRRSAGGRTSKATVMSPLSHGLPIT